MMRKSLVLMLLVLLAMPVSVFGQAAGQHVRKKPTSSQKKTSASNKPEVSNKPTSTNKPSSSKRTEAKPKGSSFSISPTSVSFSGGGGSRTFTVSGSNNWSVTTSPNSWGHLYRNGNSLTLYVDKNTTASPRSDYFVVSSGSKKVYVAIAQKGGY